MAKLARGAGTFSRFASEREKKSARNLFGCRLRRFFFASARGSV